MESRELKKINFMNETQYDSATKSKDNLYLVEIPTFQMTCFPDYSRGVAISGGTTYTVGSGALADYSEGWFRIAFQSTSWHGQQPQLVIYINGQIFYASYFCAFTMVYLTTGNTFYTNAGNGWGNKVNAFFFPNKNLM